MIFDFVGNIHFPFFALVHLVTLLSALTSPDANDIFELFAAGAGLVRNCGHPRS
jgi:hypothetical protein